MPTYFRAYCTRSGCVFDEEKGFVAKNTSKTFDPYKGADQAKEILIDHLVWANHHIPSPLISVSTGQGKPKSLLRAMKKFHGEHSAFDIFIAEIRYEVKPSNAHHLMSTAAMLGATVSQLCTDYGEWIFVGCIPLEHVVEIKQVVRWTTDLEPVSYEITWPKAPASPDPIDLAAAMGNMSLSGIVVPRAGFDSEDETSSSSSDQDGSSAESLDSDSEGEMPAERMRVKGIYLTVTLNFEERCTSEYLELADHHIFFE
ncbi:hypothetical protein C8F01DRAFT_1137055 [Mycena amicta]|nr:hypothetical protein C8F01DRAFT_1137055 [Mycena amicta]